MPFKTDPGGNSVTGTSFETVISKRVLLAIWIGNVNDMGIENPFYKGQYLGHYYEITVSPLCFCILNQYRMRYFQFHDDYFDALSTQIGRECTFLCLYKIKKKYSPFYRRVFLHFNQIMEEVF